MSRQRFRVGRLNCFTAEGLSGLALCHSVADARAQVQRAVGVFLFEALDGAEQVLGHYDHVDEVDRVLGPEVEQAIAGEDAVVEEGHQVFAHEHGAAPDGEPAGPFGEEGLCAPVGEEADAHGDHLHRGHRVADVDGEPAEVVHQLDQRRVERIDAEE